jgi:hypothetical protein
MKNNKNPKLKKWMLFFPSRDLEDVACHYWLTNVEAPDFKTASKYICVKRKLVEKQKGEFLSTKKPIAAIFHKKEYHREYYFDWSHYFDKYSKPPNNKVYQVTIVTHEGGDWLNHFLIAEVPQQLEGALLKVNCKYRGVFIEPALYR